MRRMYIALAISDVIVHSFTSNTIEIELNNEYVVSNFISTVTAICVIK